MSENERLVVVVLHGALANCHVKYARAECCDVKARVMEMPGFFAAAYEGVICVRPRCQGTGPHAFRRM